jgi:hypothetical protein
MYEWALLALLLGYGHTYCTRLHHYIVQKRYRKAKRNDTVSVGKDASAGVADAACSLSCHGTAPPSFGKPPIPNLQPLSARVETHATIVGVDNRVVELFGGDILIRRRRWGFM